MDRRAFLAGTGAALLAASHLAHAQQAGKVPRIDYLFWGVSPTSGGRADFEAAFRQGLRERGYVEGQSIAIEYRYGAIDRLPELAVHLHGKTFQHRPYKRDDGAAGLAPGPDDGNRSSIDGDV